MTYIYREIEPYIKKISKQFAVTLLTGARQSGKSTLLQEIFPSYTYVSLDDLKLRQQAIQEPELFLDSFHTPLILDEIQNTPDLLSYIKLRVDQNKIKGSYILTGSQQFSLMSNVHESLAGRMAIASLTNFSVREFFINRNKKIPAWSELCIRGLYPKLNVDKDIDPYSWYSAYIDSLINKDIKNNLKNEHLHTYEMFIKLISTRSASELKYTDLSKELGVSILTVQSWTTFLERSQLIYLLSPYYRNLGKRVIKSHKLFFLDPGLVTYLTGHKGIEQIQDGPMAGQIFESLVVSEIIKYFYNKGEKPPIFFFRDSQGVEVDLLIELDHKILLIEIKVTSNPTKNHIQGLQKVQSLLPDSKAVVLCNVKNDFYLGKNIMAIHWTKAISFLEKFFYPTAAMAKEEKI